MATRPRYTAIIVCWFLLITSRMLTIKAPFLGSKAIKQHSPDWTRWGHTLDEQEFGAQSITKKMSVPKSQMFTQNKWKCCFLEPFSRRRTSTDQQGELGDTTTSWAHIKSHHSLFIWSTLCWSESNFPPPLLNMLHLCLCLFNRVFVLFDSLPPF